MRTQPSCCARYLPRHIDMAAFSSICSPADVQRAQRGKAKSAPTISHARSASGEVARCARASRSTFPSIPIRMHLFQELCHRGLLFYSDLFLAGSAESTPPAGDMLCYVASVRSASIAARGRENAEVCQRRQSGTEVFPSRCAAGNAVMRAQVSGISVRITCMIVRGPSRREVRVVRYSGAERAQKSSARCARAACGSAGAGLRDSMARQKRQRAHVLKECSESLRGREYFHA